MPRNYQTLADYAAIGIAPLLIWWMLNSLANFLMIVLYHGNYSWHVSWILMCYTMGATALARLTIEESRERASIYAVVLGAATFYVLIRYVQDPVFLLAVILTIGYLADRIVHDCTIIDDGVDSSGQGLVDSARKWFQSRSPHMSTTDASASGWQPRKPRKTAGHQPGRTVLYLAVGALPLFGIGQFFLDNFPGSWERAKWMLTLYLFTSLSLLVVTSFLNLRRYLRQRSTEMSLQVTVAWLAGGVGMILLILLVAYIAPMPGQTLVAWRMPDFLSDANLTKATRWGFGEDGADLAGENAPATGDPRAGAQKPDGAPQIDSTNQADAEPGGETGNRKEGPAGKEKGGNKPAQDSQTPDKAGKSEAAEKSSDAGESTPSQQPESPDKSSDPSQSDRHQTSDDPGQKQSDPAQPPSSNQDESPPSNEPTTETKSDEATADQVKSPPAEADESEAANSAPPPKPTANLGGALSGLLKFVLFFTLLLVIAVYVYRYRDAWLAWLHAWLNGRDNIDPATPRRRKQRPEGPPARPFSSFANPVGTAEAGQVVVVTFQALEAWGREQGVQRGDDETPSEYVRRLVGKFPSLKQPAWRVVDAYNRVVYGRTAANRNDVTAASSVWQIMRPQL